MRLIDADALREIWVCQPGHDFEPSSFVYSIDNAPTVEPASPWHRVDEPTKEEGKYLVAYRSSVVDGWGYDTAYYTKHLEDKMLMIPVPENSEGWFKWSDYNDCDVLVHPDYWMPIEPPKE